MRLSHPSLLGLAFAILIAAACHPDARSRKGVGGPPAAEFIVAGGDSAYWISTVASDSGPVLRMRGAPIELALVAGRWFELYVVDDDRSYEDAILVGERVFRRDLISGDSVMMYQDSLVPRLAAEYARTHPNDHPLGDDEEGSEEPLWQATSTLELGAVHGPFASFSIHTDVQRGDAPLWHTSRTGVLDLARAKPARLVDVVGAEADQIDRLRSVALHAALDSVRSRRDERGQRARAMLGHYLMDSTSFEITTVDGRPAAAWSLPGSGTGDEGHLLPLAPVLLGDPAWWKEAVATLPVKSSDGQRDVWRHGSYDVVVRYSGAGDAELAVRDSTSREWIVGRISGTAARIYWLDAPPLGTGARSALLKAFREAASYDEDARVAVANRVPARPAAWRK